MRITRISDHIVQLDFGDCDSNAPDSVVPCVVDVDDFGDFGAIEILGFCEHVSRAQPATLEAAALGDRTGSLRYSRHGDAMFVRVSKARAQRQVDGICRVWLGSAGELQRLRVEVPLW